MALESRVSVQSSDLTSQRPAAPTYAIRHPISNLYLFNQDRPQQNMDKCTRRPHIHPSKCSTRAPDPGLSLSAEHESRALSNPHSRHSSTRQYPR